MPVPQKKINISVIVPAYNLEAYIGNAINSILAQTIPAFEILVIDDGSTDKTAEIIQSYGNKVRYIYQKNKKLSGARNTGIIKAKGDWLAFLDGDDIWLPKYIEKQTELLQRNPTLMWSTSNFYCYLYSENRKNAPISTQKAVELLNSKDVINNYLIASEQNMQGFSGSKIIHRTVFEAIGLFDETIQWAEDLDMWWRINYKYPLIGYCPEPLAIYYLDRPGSLTENANFSKYKQMAELLDKHLPLAKQHNMHVLFDNEISKTVQSYIRNLFFQNNSECVYFLLNKFKKQLPLSFIMLTNTLMINPKITANGFLLISNIIRKLGLRKRVMRKPTKQNML